MNKPVIVSAVRTAIGSYGGSLLKVPASELGATVIKGALDKCGVDKSEVDEVILGCVLQAGLGQNIARQCAVKAGLDVKIPAMTVNMVCNAGLRAVTLAAQIIKTGDADVVIAGGTENMSRTPYTIDKVRWGAVTGNIEAVDEMVFSGLTDIFNGYHMGITAENLAEKFNITREMQDEFAYESQIKAANAIETGKFNDEIIPVELQGRRKTYLFDEDEHNHPGCTVEGLSKQKPAFKENGTVTAGNSSGINDGAAAVIVMSEKKAKELGCEILAEIKSYSSAGVDPAIMGFAPVPAITDSLKNAGLKLDSIDLFELNEAFAAQTISVIKGLENNGTGKIDMKKVNINGGAIALGHPIGASGTRILVTLIHGMIRTGSKTGLASLCAGGGIGTSIILENKAK